MATTSVDPCKKRQIFRGIASTTFVVVAKSHGCKEVEKHKSRADTANQRVLDGFRSSVGRVGFNGYSDLLLSDIKYLTLYPDINSSCIFPIQIFYSGELNYINPDIKP